MLWLILADQLKNMLRKLFFFIKNQIVCLLRAMTAQVSCDYYYYHFLLFQKSLTLNDTCIHIVLTLLCKQKLQEQESEAHR